jgi:hypothetical protein
MNSKKLKSFHNRIKLNRKKQKASAMRIPYCHYLQYIKINKMVKELGEHWFENAQNIKIWSDSK